MINTASELTEEALEKVSGGMGLGKSEDYCETVMECTTPNCRYSKILKGNHLGDTGLYCPRCKCYSLSGSYTNYPDD